MTFRQKIQYKFLMSTGRKYILKSFKILSLF